MSTQKNKFVWPELGLDEREEAYNATPMFHNYATYEGIVKLKLSDLLLVEEYLGEVKQLARSKQIDPVTVKGITQSLSSVGIISDQPLMIVTELPNSSEKKYIVVEGNNRLAAFRNLAKNEGLNESTLNMNVMKVEITTEDFDLGIGALGHQYNQKNLYSVSNKGYNDAINLGKKFISTGHFTYRTPIDEVAYWLKEIQGVQLDDGWITKAAKAIVDPKEMARNLIQVDKELAGEVISKSLRFGANGNVKKVNGYKLFAAPLNQTVRTAVNNFSSYRGLDEGDKMRVTLWDSSTDVDDIEDNRSMYAKIWYEEYENAWNFINDIHKVNDGPMTPKEFFDHINAEFWVLSQVRGTDVFTKSVNCEEVRASRGKKYYIYRWFPEEMAVCAKPTASKLAA